MKICLVSQEYPPETAWGGVGTQTWVKARGLARLGHDVHVLACSGDGRPEMRTERHDGVTVHRIQPPGYEFPVYGKPLWLLGWTYRVAAALDALMDAHAFDVLDFPEFGGEGFGYQVDRTRWNWAPVVVQIHGSMAMFVERMGWPQRGSRLHELGTFLESFSLRNADAVMAVGAGIADIAARAYGLDRARIDVVHCGVDTGLFSPAADPEPPAGGPTVLFVGKMVKNKGPLVVAEAVLALRKKYPGIRARFIGEGKDMPTEVRDMARAAGAEDAVELVGFVPLAELPDHYRRAHVFCAPAEYEGFGQVAIEAMACGCPVVASSAGGGGEAVVEGETGLIVPPGDAVATAAALDAILGDPARRRRMRDAGLARVAAEFTMERHIAKVVAVYEKAIAASRSRSAEEREQSDWEAPPLRPGET